MKKTILLTVMFAAAQMAGRAHGLENAGTGLDLGPVYENSLGMRFVRIEPGRFLMGSNEGNWDERPVHEVAISQRFYIMDEEVTSAQYEEFDPGAGGGWYVTGISWYEAVAFTQWLSEREGLAYRLPTEAEWEYCCRAGTTTPYWYGDEPPETSIQNPWGLLNMHLVPLEWVQDWHGQYSYHSQADPLGPSHGMAKVVRGGGLDEYDPYYARSANRAGIAPGFDAGMIGIRLVLGEMPASSGQRYEAPFVRQCVKQSRAHVLQGPDPNVPYFNQRPMLSIPPDNSSGAELELAGLHLSFRGHNHSPGMEVCPNGDVLMIIYTSYGEYEPEVSLMATRLRFGADRWDMPCPMFDFPGTNDHAPLLWHDDGTVHFFWGCPRLNGANRYPFQWMSSTDNGMTWSEVKFPRFVGSVGDHSRQPINSALRIGDSIYVASDGDGGESVLWTSDDNGQTWYDPGGRTHGRHTTFVLLNNGRILGMGGKNTDIAGGYMPKSISSNRGKNWGIGVTPFSTMGSNQRPCITRLASGRLFFCSDFQRTADCFQPEGITEKGALVALSEDEGETWIIKKIPTALRHEWRSCEGATLGYAVCRQAPNGIIHVITSMNHPCQHFEMNEAWILDPSAGGDLPADPGDSDRVTTYEERYPGGALKASWSAKTAADGRYLLHGPETWYYESGQKQYEVSYRNGRKVGTETYWGVDGLKHWNWEHNQATDTSIWTQYWPNGLKKVESTWRDGGMVAHGPASHWGRCGQPIGTWNYVDGEEHGWLGLPEPQFKEPKIYYVDADANGADDGSSWANAFNRLQDALLFALGCDQIRVAQGTYYPDHGFGSMPGQRTASFQLKSGVVVRGGYAGFGEPDPDDRDVESYETILSGDLNGDDVPGFANSGENSYHVVMAGGVDETAVLDGFTITGGYADGRGLHRMSGGMHVEHGSLTIINCKFKANWARAGGGITCQGDSPLLVNCIFSGNRASTAGAIFSDGSSLRLINSTVSGNRASSGAGIFSRHANSPTIANSIFWDNKGTSGTDESAQISGTAPSINYCCVQGWTGGLGGSGNLGTDPCFVEPGYWDSNDIWVEGDYRLVGPQSPCVDAGDNGMVPPDVANLDNDADTAERIPFDAIGNWRFVDFPPPGGSGVPDPPAYEAIVDIGVYEVPVTLTALEIIGPDEAEENWQTQYTLIAHYDNNSTRDVTDVAYWLVEPQTIASIESGLLTTQTVAASRYVTIYANHSEGNIALGAEKVVSVVPISPTGLEILGPNQVPDRSEAHYSAIAHFDNGSSRAVTEWAQWGVSPQMFARVDGGRLRVEDLDMSPELTINARYTEDGRTVEAEKQVAVLAVCPGGNALRFYGWEGGDWWEDYVTIPELTNPVNLTYALWVKADSLYGYHNTLIEFENDNPYFGLLWSGQLNLYGYLVSADQVTTNEWYHVAVTSDGTKTIAYINGRQDPAEGWPNASIGTGMGIGYHNGDTPFVGMMDAVMIFDRALSPEEIQSGVHGGLGPNEPGLVGCWDFDEGAGQITHDSSGNNNDGYLGYDPCDQDWADPAWVESDAPVSICPQALRTDLRILPPVINRGGRMPKIVALVKMPEGITRDQVDPDEPLVLYPGQIEARIQWVFQSPGLSANRTIVCALFDKQQCFSEILDNGRVELLIMGSLATGEHFYGTDTVTIIGRNPKCLAAFAIHWLETGCGAPDWCDGLDVNHDGVINFADFAFFNACCTETSKL